ncbi:hypothetical protein RirG_027320 [Rhizophagus irregularis DAOM 197198w]|uniref:Uncharacterized protein n=1 Tax=Rhizophagus irregularis (strain DAOM 197198w) TaxID=1432141 RepID=A0A015LBH8_RHIIW|nr:hypothetical protein RirG_027320 [Rhizophagus irregularis DAOM 197198w]
MGVLGSQGASLGLVSFPGVRRAACVDGAPLLVLRQQVPSTSLPVRPLPTTYGVLVQRNSTTAWCGWIGCCQVGGVLEKPCLAVHCADALEASTHRDMTTAQTAHAAAPFSLQQGHFTKPASSVKRKAGTGTATRHAPKTADEERGGVWRWPSKRH